MKPVCFCCAGTELVALYLLQYDPERCVAWKDMAEQSHQFLEKPSLLFDVLSSQEINCSAAPVIFIYLILTVHSEKLSVVNFMML